MAPRSATYTFGAILEAKALAWLPEHKNAAGHVDVKGVEKGFVKEGGKQEGWVEMKGR